MSEIYAAEAAAARDARDHAPWWHIEPGRYVAGEWREPTDEDVRGGGR